MRRLNCIHNGHELTTCHVTLTFLAQVSYESWLTAACTSHVITPRVILAQAFAPTIVSKGPFRTVFNEKIDSFTITLFICIYEKRNNLRRLMGHLMKEIMYALTDLGFLSDFLEKCRFSSSDQFFTTGAEIRLPSISIVTCIRICLCIAVTDWKLRRSCFNLRSSHKIPAQPGGQRQCPFLMSQRAPFWQSSHVERQPGPIYPGGQAERQGN